MFMVEIVFALKICQVLFNGKFVMG